MTTALNILLVEDNAGDSFLIKEHLHLTPLHIGVIHSAGSLAEAVHVLESTAIDLVLLDLTLPDSNGIESFLSLNEYTASIPVVILSGLDNADTAVQTITMGAQDFLLKGEFDEKLLDKTIRYSIERKRNLEELRISNERYSLVSKATNDMVWDWDVVANKIYRSEEQFVKQLKYPANKKDYGPDFWVSLIHPEDQVVYEKILNDFENQEKNFLHEEYRILDGEGNYRHVQDRGFIIRNEVGNVIRVIGATNDITERKKNEQELRKLSLIAKETVNSVIITDADENIQWVNEAFERITGYSFAEAVGQKPGTLLQGPKSSVEQKVYIKKQIKSLQPFNCEIINYHKTGSEYWVEMQGQPVFDKEGKLLYFYSLQTDITERKKSEETLKQSEEKYRSLFNMMPASIIIWRLSDFRILEINEMALSQYGYTREEFLSLTTLDLRKPDDHQLFKNYAQRVRENPDYSLNLVWKHINKAKEEMFMQISSNRFDYNGQLAMMAIATDITEKIKLEEKLQEEKTKKETEIKQAILAAQEKEQQQIGRELHDNVNQVLASTRLFMGLVKTSEGYSSPHLDEADRLLQMAINEIRNLSHTLIVPGMHGAELLTALDNLLKHTVGAAGLQIEKETSDFNTADLQEDLKLTIYRIVQEQLNNIMKYANAKTVFLTLKKQQGKLVLRIKDDGQGFDSSKITGGVGLLNIKNRASLFNGQIHICSAPGMGCELAVTFQLWGKEKVMKPFVNTISN